MKCVTCGNEVSNNDAVCPVCGTSRAVNQQMQSSVNEYNDTPEYDYQHNSGGFCIDCGRPVPAGYRLCSECAARNVIETRGERKKFPVGLIVLIVLLFVLIGGIVAGFASGFIPDLFYSYSTVIDSDDDDESDKSDNQDDPDSPDSDDEEEERKKEEEEERKKKEKEEKLKEEEEERKKKEEEERKKEEEEKAKMQYEKYAYTSDITWKQADSIAKSKGGYIAIPDSQAEFDKLCNMADEMDLDAFWIGISRKEYEDWDEIYIPYRNWLVTDTGSEPSGYDINAYEDQDIYVEECYLMALKTNNGWRMNDTPNDISNAVGKVGLIIERDVY